MAIERTFCIIKPDAVEKAKSGAILAKIEETGFTIVALERMQLSKAVAEGFYAVHRERGFFGELVAFMTRAALVIALLAKAEYAAAVEWTVAALDRGEVRVASPPSVQDGTDGEWTTHAWIKQAVLLYFAVRKMERIEIGPFEFHDKIPLKKGLDTAG